MIIRISGTGRSDDSTKTKLEKQARKIIRDDVI